MHDCLFTINSAINIKYGEYTVIYNIRQYLTNFYIINIILSLKMNSLYKPTHVWSYLTVNPSNWPLFELSNCFSQAFDQIL